MPYAFGRTKSTKLMGEIGQLIAQEEAQEKEVGEAALRTRLDADIDQVTEQTCQE